MKNKSKTNQGKGEAMDTLKDSIKQIEPGSVAMLGIPFDEHSSYLRGSAQAPKKIREAYANPSSNTCTESVKDLLNESKFIDLGDLEIHNYIKDIEKVTLDILNHGGRVLALGGDHSITYPIIKAYAKKYDLINILQLDAHPDLYNIMGKDLFSHACTFARIMEENLVWRLVQVGIRAMNPHQAEQAERFNVEIIDMKTSAAPVQPVFKGPVYLSLDIDVLDPAFAPGVSHPEPGGLSTRCILQLIQNLDVPLIGADIVEYNPEQDLNNLTARVAAKFLKEITEKMLKS